MQPWPLMLFSHGFGGIRFQSFFFTEHLASHGMVVAAPDHPGNTIADFASLGNEGAALQSAMDCPLDMAMVLAEMLIPGAGGLALRIDPSRIAASGHSFGGWTCLELARIDPRIQVVVPLAPGFRNGATPDFVAGLARPIAFFGGSEDGTTEFEGNQHVPYDLAAPPKVLVKIVGAGHLDFSNMCDIALARLISTAFVLRHLVGETGYDSYLEEQRVLSLSNVEYWRER